MATKKPRRTSTLGTVWQTKSGSWRARYTRLGREHTPGHNFHTHALADQWLAAEQLLIARDEWTPPAARRAKSVQLEERNTLTLHQFATDWINNRTTSKGTPLAPKTVNEYRSYLTGRLSGLARMALVDIDRTLIDEWWQVNADAPIQRHHAYAFLKSVLADALDRGLITEQPCKVRNASARTVRRPKAVTNALITGLTPLDIEALAQATQPEQWQALIVLLAYSGLRPNEALALTRGDIIEDRTAAGVPRWTLKITKALAEAEGGGRTSAPPKTQESNRFVPIPPHVAEVLADHIRTHSAPGKDGLLFPSTNPANPWPTLSQFRSSGSKQPTTPKGFNAARQAIGRPELTVYDLRRWARHTWRKAGIGDADCELLLGHVLDPVMGAYVTQDRKGLWPYMDAISEAAGWINPTKITGAPQIPIRLLQAMTPTQLRKALAGMNADQLADVVPLLPAEMLAELLTNDDPTTQAGMEGRL